MATRPSIDAPFSLVRNLSEINTSFEESYPSISGDGLVLVWSDMDPSRPGGLGELDIWCAARSSRNEPFGAAINLGPPVNTTGPDFWPRLSPRFPNAGAPLYFNRCWGCGDIYRATWRPTQNPFIRGDANADGATDISDAVAILAHLFLDGEKLPCEQAGDTNDDGDLDISDAVYVLSFLFLGGTAIEPPAEECGLDPNGHQLTCDSFPACL
jgi:hypothetical protein